MHPSFHAHFRPPLSRREMLRKCSLGFGSLALAGLFSEQSRAAALTSPLAPRPHFPPKVKQVIFAYMSGGVSHVDSWDPKPELAKRHGQPMPVPVRPTMFNQNGNIMASPWTAKPRGQSGVMMTDLFPRLAEMADDIAVIRRKPVAKPGNGLRRQVEFLSHVFHDHEVVAESVHLHECEVHDGTPLRGVSV